MHQLDDGMPCSVLYPNRSNPDEEETKLNSVEELKAELTSIKEKLKPPIVERGKLAKKDKA